MIATMERDAGPVTRPAFRLHGGKFLLAARILRYLPPHRVYVEPFGGAGSVLLSKKPSELEIFNDLDSEIINFFQVLRECPDDLIRAIDLTPFALEEVNLCWEDAPRENTVERARRLYVRAWQTRGSGRGGWKAGWRRTVTAGETKAIDSWNKTDHLWAVAARFKQIYIEHDNALNVIRRYDQESACFYIDPPYAAETRGRWATQAYAHEMTTEDHERLAETLMSIKGVALVSGYGCPLYDRLYADWRRVEIDAIADGGTARTEVLWISPRAEAMHANALPLFELAV